MPCTRPQTHRVTKARIARGPGWGILHDGMLLPEEPAPEIFGLGYYGGGSGTVTVSGTRPGAWFGHSRGGRAGILFVEGRDGRQWAIRHYRRGGLFGRVIHDSYAWLGEERTRSFAEWRLLARLREAGLPVPRPVAAGYHRSGLVYRADLVTRVIPEAESLAMLVSPPFRPVPWRIIGATIRRFHDAGAHHTDLNAHNILVDRRDDVYLLDFDRGEIRGDGPWKQANLARLERSLRKIAGLASHPPFDEAGWGELLAGYEAGRRASSP